MINIKNMYALHNHNIEKHKTSNVLLNTIKKENLNLESNNKRKMSKAGIMACICATECIKKYSLDKEKTAILCATQNGEIEYIEKFYNGVLDDGPQYAPALYFPNTVMNSIAGFVSIETGITGENHTLSGRSLSVAESFEHAEQLFTTYDNVLIVASDEINDVIIKGYSDIKLLRTNNNTNGFIYGEGACAILMSKEKQNTNISNISSDISYFTHKKYDNIISCNNGSTIWTKNLDKWIKKINTNSIVEPLINYGEFFSASPLIAMDITSNKKGINLVIGCDLSGKIIGFEWYNG